MTAMPLLLSALLASATDAPLQLRISSPQTTVLVGEPIKLRIERKALRAVEVFMPEQQTSAPVRMSLWVDRGTGPREYREISHLTLDEMIVMRRKFKAGEEAATTFVLVRGMYLPDGQESFVFPEPGRYTLKASHAEPPAPGIKGFSVESNVLVFHVVAPETERDRELYDLVKKKPDLLTNPFRIPRPAAMPALSGEVFEKYPASPYLRWARVQFLEAYAHALVHREDPETGERMWHLDKAALALFATEHYRRMAEEVFAEDWGPFEEERLDKAAGLAEAIGQPELAKQYREELVQRFPESTTVRRMMREAEDEAGAYAEALEGLKKEWKKVMGSKPLPSPLPTPPPK